MYFSLLLGVTIDELWEFANIARPSRPSLPTSTGKASFMTSGRSAWTLTPSIRMPWAWPNEWWWIHESNSPRVWRSYVDNSQSWVVYDTVFPPLLLIELKLQEVKPRRIENTSKMVAIPKQWAICDINLLYTIHLGKPTWLVVWNIFPYTGNHVNNWLSYFSEGLQSPTSYHKSTINLPQIYHKSTIAIDQNGPKTLDQPFQDWILIAAPWLSSGGSIHLVLSK